MPAKNGKHESSVIELLLNEPHRFQFVQLVNLLLILLRRQGIPYEKALGEVIRFSNSLSLAFPASEVEAVAVDPKPLSRVGAPRPLRWSDFKRIRITPTFIGLLGASGALPLHDTERMASRRAVDGDSGQHELLDLFSHRVVSLFYEAWGKYRVEHSLNAKGKDQLLPMLMAMAGIRKGHHGHRQTVKDETTAYYAALLRTRPIAAATVERVLTEYFGIPVRLEQFVGCWGPIPENRRSTLGTTKPTLGFGAALGSRMWSHNQRARLHIGPLEEKQVEEFLPGGGALCALQELVNLFAVPTLRYEVRLLLAAPCIKRMTLSTKTPERRQLGWNTFLTDSPGVASRPDIRLMLGKASTSQPPETATRAQPEF